MLITRYSLIMLIATLIAGCSYATESTTVDSLSVEVDDYPDRYTVKITNVSSEPVCIQEPEFSMNVRVFAFVNGTLRESTTTAGRTNGKPKAVLLESGSRLELEVGKVLLTILIDAEEGDQLRFEYEASRRPTSGSCVPIAGLYRSKLLKYE